MKNRSIRLVAVVLLSAMAGMSLAGTNPMLGSKQGFQQLRSIVNVSMDYPAESDDDARLFSDKDMKVRRYVYDRTQKRSGTYLLTKDGKSVDEVDVKTLDGVLGLLKVSSVVTEVVLERNMSQMEDKVAIENAAKEAFKKTYQYGDWKYFMRKQVGGSPYTEKELVPGYVLVRGCSGHTSIFRINPKRIYSGEMRDVTSGDYYNDRKNSFLRDRRFLNATDSISAARSDPEYDRMVKAINNIWTLQGNITLRSKTASACPNANPLFPELDSVVCGDVRKKLDILRGGEMSTTENVSASKVKIPDLSKLIDLVKQSVEYLRRINAMRHKPSEEDYAGYNKLGAMARAEIKAIENEIVQMNLTEKEKVELGDELGKRIRAKVMPRCDTLKSLRKQIEAKGYGRFEDSNFNFDPKYLK